MRTWLAVAAVMPLVSATAAHAQMKGLLATDVAHVARTHELDLRLSQQKGFDGPQPLVGGMVVRQDVSPNAFVGFGLANIYGRKKRTLRINEPAVLSRKPAVTMVLKF